MLIRKSNELEIDLNKSDSSGKTAFLMACHNGQKEIIEMLLDRSSEFKIDTDAK